MQKSSKTLSSRLKKWADDNGQKTAKIYDSLEPFPIENDRLAELLLPLQAVLTVIDEGRLGELKEYSESIDKKNAATETPGVQLLIACKQIFDADAKTCRMKPENRKTQFIASQQLIAYLVDRVEEPWCTWSKGNDITPRALGHLLRQFGISSEHDTKKTQRGYLYLSFKDAWSRYTP